MRYKQTLLGVVWAVIQPIMYMVVFTLFFGRFLGRVLGGRPYALLALSGLGDLALLRELGDARRRQPRRQRVAAHQGLLPAPARAARADPRRARRPRACDARPARGDGRLRRVPRAAARVDGDPVRAARRRHCGRCRRVARRAERQVPRHPLRRPVPPAALAVRELGVHHVRGAEPLAAVRDALLAEPDGRRRRGVPLGDARRRAARARGTSPSRARAGSSILVSGLVYFKRMERDFADIV